MNIREHRTVANEELSPYRAYLGLPKYLHFPCHLHLLPKTVRDLSFPILP